VARRSLLQPAQPESKPNLTQTAKHSNLSRLKEEVVYSNLSTTTTEQKSQPKEQRNKFSKMKIVW
jgi:hypothetical protein